MRYGRINKTDIANGPGVRVSLFVSGCRNRCKGCFQPATWDFNYGEEFTIRTLLDLDRALEQDYIDGLTILGGDPFEPENIHAVTAICKIVKYTKPDKTIWIYTGYKYEDFKDRKIMDYIDVLVDGPFIESKKDISLQFRGSSNQRVIDIPATRKAGEIKLWRQLKMNKQKFTQIIKEGIARNKNFMVIKIKGIDDVNSKILIIQGEDIKPMVEKYLRVSDDNMIFKDTLDKVEDVLLTNNLNDLSWFVY